MKIEEVEKAITDFFKSSLGGKVKVIKIIKSKDGWEESSFIKSLGLSTEVVFYARKEESVKEE